MAVYEWTSDSSVALSATSSVHPIHGEIRGLRGQANVEVRDGQIQLDPAPTAYIEGDVAQLETGKKLEDIALRKQINAKQFPTVRYEVRRVEGGPGNYKVHGAFTFHGVTREFTEEVSARAEGDTIVVEGDHTVDIRDFGVQPFKILSLKIDPDVALKVRLVGRPAGSGRMAWG